MELHLLSQNDAVVGLLAIFSVLYFLLWRFKPAKIAAAKNRSPPEAGGAWPIIGHLHLFRGSKSPHKTLAALAEKYGPAFTIRLGMHRNLIVSNWEVAKELFTTHDMAILSRPTFLVGKYLSYDNAMFGFSPYGAYWREIRKINSMELLSARRLELLKHVRVSETEMFTKKLYKLWSDQQDRNVSATKPVLVDIEQWFGDLNLNVILRMVVGKRYFGPNAIDVCEENEARYSKKLMREFLHLLGVFLVADSVPFLGWLDFEGYEKKMKETGKEIDQLFEQWSKEHHRKKEAGEATGDRSFMDVLLSVMDGTDIAGGYDAETITKATCINLIAGGTDTTAVMLTWAVSLLMNNPKVLKKAQEELDLQVGRQRRVNESDINNLVYLQAIIKETLRLYPAAPLGAPREFAEDCIVGGYHISKGTRLMLNIWNIHRDPNVWPNPSEFRPERFLTTHKNVDVKGNHFELIPFSAGRRICPGMNLGLQMLHLALANLLHAFDLSTPSNEPVDMTESVGLNDHKATPLQLLVAPRLLPNLFY